MKASRISIVLSDPWELGEALNWQPLEGKLLRMEAGSHGGRALIELDRSVSYKGSACRFVIASPRHVGDEIMKIESGDSVSCAFIGIADEQAASSAFPDARNWRGGVAFIGDLAEKKTSGPRSGA